MVESELMHIPATSQALSRRNALLLMGAVAFTAACGSGDDAAGSIETNGGGVLVQPPDVLSGETDVVDGQDTAENRLGVEAPVNENLPPNVEFTWFDGTQGSIHGLAGQPTVLNFWASTCPPCIAEMPEFEEVSQALLGEVAFVGMNTSDRREAADRLAVQTGVTYPLAEDPQGEVFRAFSAFVMPTTVFLNADGEVAHTWSGVLTGSELRILIDRHIAPGTNTGA